MMMPSKASTIASGVLHRLRLLQLSVTGTCRPAVHHLVHQLDIAG